MYHRIHLNSNYCNEIQLTETTTMPKYSKYLLGHILLLHLSNCLLLFPGQSVPLIHLLDLSLIPPPQERVQISQESQGDHSGGAIDKWLS